MENWKTLMYFTPDFTLSLHLSVSLSLFLFLSLALPLSLSVSVSLCVSRSLSHRQMFLKGPSSSAPVYPRASPASG